MPPLRILLTGDLVLDVPGPDHWLSGIVPALREADLVVGHLEVPHTLRGQEHAGDVPAPGADAVQVGQQIQRQWSGYLSEERLQDIVQIVTQSVSEIPRSSTSQKARQILTSVGPPAGRGGLPGGGVR